METSNHNINGAMLQSHICSDIKHKTMKKTMTLFFAIIFLLINNCKAQNTTAKDSSKNKGYIGINAGVNIPMSRYAGTTPTIINGVGYAKTGERIDLSFGYKLSKSIGIAGMLSSIINSMDEQALTNNYSKLYYSNNVKITSTSWYLENIMLGAYGSFSNAKKCSFESRVMIGALIATKPEIIMSAASYKQDEKSATSANFCYLFGIGLKYNINDKLCFLSNLDYTGSKIIYSNIPITNSNGAKSSYTANLTYTAINIGIGLGFRL